jgi:hypothetical protein
VIEAADSARTKARKRRFLFSACKKQKKGGEPPGRSGESRLFRACKNGDNRKRDEPAGTLQSP